MNIALPDALRAFVAQRVESGEYGNTSEYVRELIRKDQREQRVQRLRALVEEGVCRDTGKNDTHPGHARPCESGRASRQSRVASASSGSMRLTHPWSFAMVSSRSMIRS